MDESHPVEKMKRYSNVKKRKRVVENGDPMLKPHRRIPVITIDDDDGGEQLFSDDWFEDEKLSKRVEGIIKMLEEDSKMPKVVEAYSPPHSLSLIKDHLDKLTRTVDGEGREGVKFVKVKGKGEMNGSNVKSYNFIELFKK